MGYTVKKAFTLKGVGIHSGETVSLLVKPARSGGIRFVAGGEIIPLSLRYIFPQNLGTNLVKNGVMIKTIEHLSAILWYLQLTDLVIEVEGGEVPIMDGSGHLIYEAFKKAGRLATKTKRKVLTLSRPVHIFRDDIFLIALPSKTLQINYTIHFPQNPIKSQNIVFKKRSDFLSAIVSARTFGNVEDVEKLHASGRALGATVENVLAYNSDEYVNVPRFEDEAVRHKVLDLLGDLYTGEYDVRAKIIAYKTSHAFNNKALKALIRSRKK
jgi:UDP-3-O-[3-hydroxymyristoyl] N-acetylglucosamine deacetylase